jgi:hypothetical protein
MPGTLEYPVDGLHVFPNEPLNSRVLWDHFVSAVFEEIIRGGSFNGSVIHKQLGVFRNLVLKDEINIPLLHVDQFHVSLWKL